MDQGRPIKSCRDGLRTGRDQFQQDEDERVVEPIGHAEADRLAPRSIRPVAIRLKADDVVPEEQQHIDDREAQGVGDRIPPAETVGKEPEQTGIDPNAQDPADEKPKQTCKKGLREFQWNGALS